MNEHEKLPEWIDRFNNKDLHGKELREFLELMKQNPELRREVKLDEELNEALADTDVIELRKKIVKYRIPKEGNHSWLPVFFLAASITILIGLAIFVYIWMKQADESIMKTNYTYYPSDTSLINKKQLTNEERMTNGRVESDSVTSHKKPGDIKTDDKLLLADNYKPYPPYESMVGEVSRAVNFKLIKPYDSNTFRKGSLITFSWETASFVVVTITITDNKGQSLFVSQPIDDKKFLFNTSKLPEGLYYIKFIYNDEIVYFGKFTLQ